MKCQDEDILCCSVLLPEIGLFFQFIQFLQQQSTSTTEFVTISLHFHNLTNIIITEQVLITHLPDSRCTWDRLLLLSGLTWLHGEYRSSLQYSSAVLQQLIYACLSLKQS